MFLKTNLLIVCLVFFTYQGLQAKDLSLSELKISGIHQAYKVGDYSSQDLVKAYIARIKQYDEKTNAISIINPKAIEIAIALDDEYAKTRQLRPLHGIPILVKDNINTIGLPTTAGSLALKDFIPDTNAPIITKLVNAGAIIIAKTNMAEWAFSPKHTESSTHGTTRNPYNLDYVPAGSSGGTGAGVAANFAACGLGTDTGNSIRGPSSHNALVGFRTTLGLISRSGIVPLYLRNDVVGPMCRTVADATKVMQVMIGFDPTDPITQYSDGKTKNSYTQFLDKDGLKGARIGVLRELSEDNADPEVSVLFNQSIKDLEKLGAIIVDPFVVPKFAELRQNQWCAEFKKDVEDFLTTHVKQDEMKSLTDIIRVGTKSEYARVRLESAVTDRGRYGTSDVRCGDAYSDPLRIAFREAIEMAMDRYQLDAIVYPSWNNKPALVDKFEEGYLGDNNQVIAPHTGQPAFTVPMGFTGANLPAGLQFLGRMYSEDILIRLAYAYEQATKHRTDVSF